MCLFRFDPGYLCVWFKKLTSGLPAHEDVVVAEGEDEAGAGGVTGNGGDGGHGEGYEVGDE